MKSVDFIKGQIEADKVGETFPKEDWDAGNVMTDSFSEVLKDSLTYRKYGSYYKNGKAEANLSNLDRTTIRNIKVAEKEVKDYDYFLSRQDLAVIPVVEGESEEEARAREDSIVVNAISSNAEEIFDELIAGTSYGINNVPKDYEENFVNYDLKYTIGDLVIRLDVFKDAELKDYDTPQSGYIVTLALPTAVKYVKHKEVKKEEPTEEVAAEEKVEE